MKKMLAIILVSLVLSGCEKNGSQNDLIINNTEEENVVMDENDDYELKNIEMGRKEEKDISDRLRKMVGKCKRIYSQADKGNASNIVLEEETVHTMIESIAEENVAITCGSHDYNMLNYKQVDDALSLAKTGENTETEFFVINTSGVWIYNKLQFKNKDLYVTSATAAFDDNMSPHIVQIEKIQVYDWNYTDKGWIIWEKALSRNQEMDMHVFYRILPLDEQCRELGNKCITPVSYFCNNLFLVDWNQNSLENIEFNDLFEFLYTMKYGEKIDEKKYASGIPKVEFEEVVTTYFDISIETLEIYAQYDDVKGVYPWEAIGPYVPYNYSQEGVEYYIPKQDFEEVIQTFLTVESEVLESNAIYNAETKTYLYRPRGLYDYGSTYEPYPEVVSYEKMDDGKIKLIINAVWERTMQDNAMTSELVIQPLDNNRFHYISNQVIKSNLDDTSKWYRNRLTYGEWNKIYKENDEIK